MQWLDVKGQYRAMRLVQMAYRSGRMPHAWLFYGPAGVGKEMLAVRMARLLLCAEPAAIEVPEQAGDCDGQWLDGCGSCQDCRLVETGSHPDLRLIYRGLAQHHPDPAVQARKATELSVDVVRYFLLDPARAKPSRGRAQVFIVREAELLSPAAQNALLKTLEEPPADTYIVLLSSAKDRLLPTTLSRCQPVEFAPLATDVVMDLLVDAGLSGDEAEFYALISEGRPGWALELASVAVMEDFAKIGRQIASLRLKDCLTVAGQWAECISTWAKQLGDEASGGTQTERTRRAAEIFFVLVGTLFREALRLASGADETPRLAGYCDSLGAIARMPVRGIAEAIRLVSRAESAVARNANLNLTLEALAADLCALMAASGVD